MYKRDGILFFYFLFCYNMKRKIDKMSTNAFSHSKRTAALLVALSDTKERGRREDAERGRCGGRRAMWMECQSARDGGEHAGLHLVPGVSGGTLSKGF